MNNFSRLLERLSGMTGRQRYIAAFAAGVCTTLSMPPLGFFPILGVCIPVFIILSRIAATRRQAFLTGWSFGAGFFIFGFYWISAALFVDIHAWWWVLPLSSVAGPGIYALYYGFIPLLAFPLRHKDIQSYALLLASIWGSIEWLRGHLFTGFPWNLIGYAWSAVLPVMQASAIVGIYGLTLLTLLWSCTPLFLVKKNGKSLSYFLTLIFIVVFSLGAARLYTHPTVQNNDYRVRIVQPNLSQMQKWDRSEAWKNLEHHLKLTSAAAPQPFTFYIWPETSTQAPVQSFSEAQKYLSTGLLKNTYGLIGALHIDGENDALKFFNGLSVINGHGDVIATYEKHHLVPFGEYIPYRKIFNATPIAASISGMGDFSSGAGPATIRVGQLPGFSPLICYEVIFPSAVTTKADRPDWLVNVTNDGWYGKTAGPHQHFEIARVRAIEEGLPLARAANTGISAMVDPVGRIVAKKDLGQTGVVDSLLPAPLAPTLYSKFGDLLFLMLLIASLLSSFFLQQKNK